MEIRLDNNYPIDKGTETALIVSHEGNDLAVIHQPGIIFAFFEAIKKSQVYQHNRNSPQGADLERLIDTAVKELGVPTAGQPGTIKIPAPPMEIYKVKQRPDAGVSRVVTQRMELPILDDSKFPNGVEKPETGGILIHHVGFHYPQKGFHIPQAVSAANIAKRLLWNQARIFSKSKLLLLASLFSYRKILKLFIREYPALVEVAVQPYEPYFYMEERYMTKLALAVRRIIETFFKELGLDGTDFAEVISLCIEHDTAYYYRLEDILSETDGKKMYYRPAEEIKTLLRIFKERDPTQYTQSKFDTFAKLLGYMLLLPKIKRAFQAAIKSVDFKDLQYDEGDRYRVMPWSGYDFFGEPLESRRKRWDAIHHGNLPPLVPVGDGLTEVV